jgi:hypothetical protein
MAGAAALGAAVLVFVGAVLPPRARVVSPPDWQPSVPTVRGVFHVHTIRSDGTGTVDDVAAAAARAGLQFVIFADHGNGTRKPDPPTYRSGVLCLDGVEISTSGGHYAAIGMTQAPYPLGGEPRDVAEDVRRLGGIGIVTHPDSSKAALAWHGPGARFDGLEWLNADSEWRDKSRLRLAVAVMTYGLRPAESVASLFRRPAATLARWDEAQRGLRAVVGIAGSDAHAKIGWKNEADPQDDRTLARLPSYESVFRAFSIHVVLGRKFSGDARSDADALLSGIRSGRLHSIVDAFARPGVFEFTGRTGGMEPVTEGDSTPLFDVLMLRARSNAPPGSRVVLFRDGREVQRVTAPELTYATNRAGVYRVEVWLPGVADPAMPWIVSNAIRAIPASLPPPPAAAPSAGPAGPVVATLDAATGWAVEHEPSSSGRVAARTRDTSLEYRLGSAQHAAEYAALVHPVSLPASAAVLAFTGAAPAPMRVSVQLRAPKGHDGERWQRSVYLDATPRDLVVPFDDMRPTADTRVGQPLVGGIDTLLFVVDRVNAPAGAAGAFTVSNVRVLAKK